MKLPGKTLVLLTALTLGSALLVQAQDKPAPGPGGPGAPAHGDEKETPLGTKMKIIAKSVKQLKNQIADPAQQASSITLVETAKQAATDAKTLQPAKTTTVPEADRAKFLTDFQAQMDVLIKDLDTIDSDLKAANYTDAQKVFGDLGKVKGDGHKQFINKQD